MSDLNTSFEAKEIFPLEETIESIIASIETVANENILLQNRINHLELRVADLENRGKVSWAGV